MQVNPIVMFQLEEDRQSNQCIIEYHGRKLKSFVDWAKVDPSEVKAIRV